LDKRKLSKIKKPGSADSLPGFSYFSVKGQPILDFRFWILDFGFWIDPDHKGQTILDFGFRILDLLGTQGACKVLKQSKI
jgi:hypothetical protein